MERDTALETCEHRPDKTDNAQIYPVTNNTNSHTSRIKHTQPQVCILNVNIYSI